MKIIDSTLREGIQVSGIWLSLDQKLKILQNLKRTGVTEIEVGIASAQCEDVSELLCATRDNEQGMVKQYSVWSRCVPADIQYAALLGADVVSLSIPVSKQHLVDRLGKSKKWALETVRESVGRAIDLGLRVSIGFEDATRGDQQFLLDISEVAKCAGVFRIRIADTIGCCSSLEVSELMRKLVKTGHPVEYGFHGHNDFGMATGNSIAALEAGATWADVTILGMGERSGCARLEEVAAFLHIRHKRDFDLKEIKALAELVSKMCNRPVPKDQPIVGSDIFHCETGLHVHGLQVNPKLYEPFDPEVVGAKRRFLFGRKSGRAAVRGLLENYQGGSPKQQEVSDYLRQVKAYAEQINRPFTAEEFFATL